MNTFIIRLEIYKFPDYKIWYFVKLFIKDTFCTEQY